MCDLVIRTSVLCDWFLEMPSSGGVIVVCKSLPSVLLLIGRLLKDGAR